jgi:hypothetical protein
MQRPRRRRQRLRTDNDEPCGRTDATADGIADCVAHCVAHGVADARADANRLSGRVRCGVPA